MNNEQTIEITQPDGSVMVITKSKFFELLDVMSPEIKQMAYNQAIDDAIELIKNYYLDNPNISHSGHLGIVADKISQLKKPIPQTENKE